ncbi:MAG: FAD-binding protein [Rhizobiales bacterium PAR1]|nr:MAG: FAD-binding protein [Rhizobiales bacterium PAR1]
MIKISRRKALAVLGAIALPPAALPTKAQQRLVLNDASGLNPTPVFSHWHVQKDEEKTLIEQLRRELKEAAAAKRAVSVGAARHSMGGQALARNGVAMTFDVNRVELDRSAKTYRAHAGTRWHQVIAHLDPAGFSPLVLQSNADFGIGATFSVNAHGWATPHGPFGSTVRSIRLLLADGTLVTCSRTENAELFGHAMGGYGLFGIILDLEVEMVENQLLRPHFDVMPAGDFATRFIQLANDPAVRMIYGRLNVARTAFLSEALLVTFRGETTPVSGLPPASQKAPLGDLPRRVYRAQIDSERGKSFRWFMERSAAPYLASGIVTRNNLLNKPVAGLRNRDPRRTDILHEYFVPPERFGDFLAGCRRIIPKAQAEFLNVTLRHVKKDMTSTLTYAGTDRIAAVMSFSQRIEPRFEGDMIATTEQLIDLVASLGGSFYLPYRLHARPDQISRIYPDVVRFFDRKRHFDPGMLFRNTMWETYFA